MSTFISASDSFSNSYCVSNLNSDGILTFDSNFKYVCNSDFDQAEFGIYMVIVEGNDGVVHWYD